MQGDYPHFKTTYMQEELVEHFLLNPMERALALLRYASPNHVTMEG